jgi:hypothetical protein
MPGGVTDAVLFPHVLIESSLVENIDELTTPTNPQDGNISPSGFRQYLKFPVVALPINFPQSLVRGSPVQRWADVRTSTQNKAVEATDNLFGVSVPREFYRYTASISDSPGVFRDVKINFPIRQTDRQSRRGIAQK